MTSHSGQEGGARPSGLAGTCQARCCGPCAAGVAVSSAPGVSVVPGTTMRRDASRLAARVEARALVQTPDQRRGPTVATHVSAGVPVMSGGLLSSSVVELVFRYRESVEGLRAVQQEMRAPRRRAGPAVSRGDPPAAPGGHPHPRHHHGRDYGGLSVRRCSRCSVWPRRHARRGPGPHGTRATQSVAGRMVLPEDLADRAGDAAFVQAQAGTAFFGPVYFVRQSEPYMRMAVPIERCHGRGDRRPHGRGQSHRHLGGDYRASRWATRGTRMSSRGPATSSPIPI